MDKLCEHGTYIKKSMTQGIWCNKVNDWCAFAYMCTNERKVKHTPKYVDCRAKNNNL